MGDLVHVPSEVVIWKKIKTVAAVDEWKKTEKPVSLLVTSINVKDYEVLHENQYWLVDKKNAYKI